MPAAKKGRKGNRKRKEPSLEIPSDLYQYDKNEVVLCFHGPCLYKAKILKRTINAERNQPLYFVHYHGWNQQWDEWVESDRILKHTPDNLTKMKQIEAAIQNNTEKSKRTKGNVNNHNNNNTNIKKKINKKKRQIEDSEESESDTNNQDIINSTNKLNSSSSSDSSEHDEELQKLINQKNELKNKDLDDYTLNQKIVIHQNKKQKINSSTNAVPTNTNNNNKRERQRKCRNMDKVDGSNGTEQDRIARKKFEEKLRTITIPTALKDNLVQQYHLIHYDEKLIKLPKPNGFRINDILDEILKEQQNKLQQKIEKKVEPDDLKSHQTICELLPFINEGIRGFFKNTLKLNLLYNFEKPQLDVIYGNDESEDKDEIDLCDIYGAEHLVRLFYILPNILMHTQGINENNFAQIKQCTSIIIQFLSKHKTKYLVDYTLDSNEDANKNGKNIEEYVESVDDEYLSKVRKIGKKYENRYHVGHLHND